VACNRHYDTWPQQPSLLPAAPLVLVCSRLTDWPEDHSLRALLLAHKAINRRQCQSVRHYTIGGACWSVATVPPCLFTACNVSCQCAATARRKIGAVHSPLAHRPLLADHVAQVVNRRDADGREHLRQPISVKGTAKLTKQRCRTACVQYNGNMQHTTQACQRTTRNAKCNRTCRPDATGCSIVSCALDFVGFHRTCSSSRPARARTFATSAPCGTAHATPTIELAGAHKHTNHSAAREECTCRPYGDGLQKS
jgi:hypothetical protein